MTCLKRTTISLFVSLVFISGCNDQANSPSNNVSNNQQSHSANLPYLSTWENVNSSIKQDPKI
ncbi:MAG: hypothetical protein ACRC9M_09935, partial [Aeromonas sp.]